MCHTRNRGGTKEDCSSKIVGELCTVSCVSGDSNSVDLPQISLCESNESLPHIFGPENFTCVADVCSYVPNLDDSVVSDCGSTRSCGQATRAQPGARRAVYTVSETPSKFSLASQMVLCQEHSLSASLCHVKAPKVDSEYGVDVCIDSADERSCVVSCASGYSIVGDPAV